MTMMMHMLPRRGWRSAWRQYREMSSNETNQADATLRSIISQINELDESGRARLSLHLSKSSLQSSHEEAESNETVDSQYLDELWNQHANEAGQMSKHGFRKLIGSSRYRQSFAASSSSEADGSRAPPSKDSLRALFFASALPFVAFGFLDNSIMILCGEQIDEMFGARLALTTLASAGLGNLIADVTGVTAANAIESGVKRLPLRAPRLSSYQETLSSAVSTRFWGSVIGVSIGCLLGLSPLLIRGTFFTS
jgi:hypothetical protein